jgi:GNAT superfamily N-acetyltransferase
MPPGQQTIKLVETKDIERFIPIMREIDFGDQFLLSVLHWCGVGKRPTPLEYWKVFLLQSDEEIVGISGLYRQSGMPSHVCWLGWFAIRPRFRRRGLGSAAIHRLFDAAGSATCKELLVYTGSQDHVARSFYMSLGFELLGPARDCASGRTMDDSDIVLRRMLVAG